MTFPQHILAFLEYHRNRKPQDLLFAASRLQQSEIVKLNKGGLGVPPDNFVQFRAIKKYKFMKLINNSHMKLIVKR